MKKKIIVIVLGFIFYALTADAQPIDNTLGQEDIMALSQPSIVKIYHQIGGTLSIPTIRLDIKTMTLAVDNEFKSSSTAPYIAYKDYVISNKFDYTVDPQTVYGTGFIINSDGFIVTNAHVASAKYLEENILNTIEKNLVDDILGAYDDRYPGKLEQMFTGEDWDRVYSQLDATMLKILMDYAKLESKLVAIPQSSTDTTLKDILKDGFSAKVVSVMDDLFTEKNQDKDLAVIKIEQNNLPALKIDSLSSAKIGQKIFIWGFPSSAEFNDKDVINPTLTVGIINAFKDSSDKSFKLIQTDAKISEGSSGSPILNEKGEVIGIVTYSSADDGTNGDKFGWGIPAELILENMKNGSVSNSTSFYDNFSAGIGLMNIKKCRDANEKFNGIKNTNEKFPVNQYIQPYIDDCLNLINSGKSMDSIWAEIWVVVKEFLVKAWALLVIVIAGIAGLILTIINLRNQNIKEEADIAQLKNSLGKDETEITKIETTVDTHEKEITDLKDKTKDKI